MEGKLKRNYAKKNKKDGLELKASKNKSLRSPLDKTMHPKQMFVKVTLKAVIRNT